MAEADRSVAQPALAVGAAVHECFGHRAEGDRRDRTPFGVKNPGPPPHGPGNHPRGGGRGKEGGAGGARAGTRAREGLWTQEELHAILACPNCRGSLAIRDGVEADCNSCGASYRRLTYGWDLTPPRRHLDSDTWRAWEVLQDNGAITYEVDPEHNLGVGDRSDFLAFGEFCKLAGVVLDVGCGPQAWPTHFGTAAPGTRFVGVDPLVGERPADYPQVRGLAEHLPFADESFDHIVFATTIDHFVDPVAALREAIRVRRPNGTIEAFLGHKRDGAPTPAHSPDWYLELKPPNGYDDLFHIKRIDPAAAEELFARSGLQIADSETLVIDEFRSNHFFRLLPA